MHVHKISDGAAPSPDTSKIDEIHAKLVAPAGKDADQTRAGADSGHLEPHQQRVVEEKGHLDVKIARLNKFRDTEAFKNMPVDERRMLSSQECVMQEYSTILGKRIALFSKKPDDTKGDDRGSMSRLGDQGGETQRAGDEFKGVAQGDHSLPDDHEYNGGHAVEVEHPSSEPPRIENNTIGENNTDGIALGDQVNEDVYKGRPTGSAPMNEQRDHRIPPNDQLSDTHLGAVEQQDRLAADLAATNRAQAGAPDQGTQASLTGGPGLLAEARAETERPTEPEQEQERAEDRQKNASGFNAAEQEHHDTEHPNAASEKPVPGSA